MLISCIRMCGHDTTVQDFTCHIPSSTDLMRLLYSRQDTRKALSWNTTCMQPSLGFYAFDILASFWTDMHSFSQTDLFAKS